MSDKTIVRSEGTLIWTLDDGTPEVWRKVPGFRVEASNHGDVRKRIYIRRVRMEEEDEDPGLRDYLVRQRRRTKQPPVYRTVPRFYKPYPSPSKWAVYPWRGHAVEADVAELVWRAFYESIPVGYTIAFRDGDPANVKLLNLYCVPKKQE